jgi:integrase
MPTIAKLPSGSWRVQVRRKGRYVSETFLRRDDALRWSRLAELSVDRNETPVSTRIGRLTKFGELIKLRIEDMTAVGKPPRRSKAATLDMLQRELGAIKITALDRERLIQFGRARSEAGSGPVTLGIDIGTIGLVLSHAAAVHGLPISTEHVTLARIALKGLGLVGKGMERDRRPTESDVESLIALFEANERQIIPVGRIIRFAIATAMRLDEICRVDWADVNERTRMLLIRDRKDPRNKQGNDQRIPLLGPSGYDGWTILAEQALHLGTAKGRIFPYNSRSVGTAFRRGCRALGIKDLHFHDLRHEGTSRLFEAGFAIEQVSLVTGHKDWKMLRRYTHLKPEALHDFARRA